MILITLDTTRADHLSCYGYGKPTSPNLDRVAEDALIYTKAYAVSSWTLPTHASLFTGKYPSAHGAQYDPEGALRLTQGIEGDPSWDAYRANPLHEQEVTLASILREAGYATGAVIAGPWLKKVFKLDAGFDFYSDENFMRAAQVGELNGRDASDVTKVALEFVEEHEDEPFFLFLNYYDPHGPLMNREPYARQFLGKEWPNERTDEAALALYDGEIRYMDDHLGVFFDGLREKGLYEDAWIIVTSDHGELMGEHGLRGHGNSLSQQEIHIPLIVKEPGPDRPRGVDTRTVQQVDVMPTLLKRLGLPAPPNMQGQPLAEVDHPIVAEVYPLPMMSAAKSDPRQQGDWRAILAGKYKYTWSGEGHHALYDLERDPDEKTNILEHKEDVAQDLERAVLRYLETLPEPGVFEDLGSVGEDVSDLLQSHGYAGGEE